MAILGALVYKFVDFLKYLKSGDTNAAVTQLIAWVSGVVAISLFAHSDFATSIDLGGQSLPSLNFVSQVIVGLSATSLFSAFYDLKSALDNKDSARTPALVVEGSNT